MYARVRQGVVDRYLIRACTANLIIRGECKYLTPDDRALCSKEHLKMSLDSSYSKKMNSEFGQA